VRDWLGRGEDFQTCPHCKGNRKPNTVLHKDRLKPCMSLDSAAREFKEARATLLQAVLYPGYSNSEGLSCGKGSRKKAIGSSRSGVGYGDRGSGNSSRRAFGAQQQQELDGYWAGKAWSTILKRHPGYHTIKEKVLRQELGAMNMTSNGKKEELVFRHQTFIKLAEAEADKVKLGHQTRSRGEVIQEVEKKAQVRFNNGSGGMGGGRQAIHLDSVAQHKGFDEMIRAIKRQQKEQKRKDHRSSEGGGREGDGGKGRGRQKGEDVVAHTEGQEVERKDNNSEQKIWEKDEKEVKEDVSDEREPGTAAPQSIAALDLGAGVKGNAKRDVNLDATRNGIDAGNIGDGAGRGVASLSPIELQEDIGAVAHISMGREEEREEEDIVIIDSVTKSNSYNSNNLKRRVGASSGNGNESGHHKRPYSLLTSLTAKSSLPPSTIMTTSWNCQSCTLTNAGPVRNCAACGVPRQVSIARKDSLKVVQDTQQKLFEEARKQQQKQPQLVPSSMPVTLERKAGESISPNLNSANISTSADIVVRLLRVDGALGPSYHMLGKSRYEKQEGQNVEREEGCHGNKKDSMEAGENWSVDEHETCQFYSPSY